MEFPEKSENSTWVARRGIEPLFKVQETYIASLELTKFQSVASLFKIWVKQWDNNVNITIMPNQHFEIQPK